MTWALIFTGVVSGVLGGTGYWVWHRRHEGRIDRAVFKALKMNVEKLHEDRMSAKMQRQASLKARRPKRRRRRA